MSFPKEEAMCRQMVKLIFEARVWVLNGLNVLFLFVCLFFAVICTDIQHILWCQDRFIISLWTSSIFLKQGQVSGEGGFSFHFTISHCWFSLRYLLKVLIHWKRGHALKVDKKDWANLEASTGNHQQNALNSQISHKFWT